MLQVLPVLRRGLDAQVHLHLSCLPRDAAQQPQQVHLI